VKSLATWTWISRVRERETLKLYLEHAKLVLGVLEHAHRALVAYSSNDKQALEAEWSEVFRLEREADSVKRRILADLATGVFHAVDREELTRLILVSDDLASRAKAWTRRLELATYNSIPRTLLELLVKMASRVVEAYKLIIEATSRLVAGDSKSVLEICDKVELYEEEVDDLRISALREVYKYCDLAKTSMCLLAKEIVDLVEEAADKCEDVADVLRNIALLRA
jgi:predicted phosphate transport protein (TIGR00153 family)